MNLTGFLRFSFPILAGLIFSCLALTAIAQEKKEADKKHHQEQKRVWSELSETEKESLKKSLREVWVDPSVLSARENVSRATIEYREAVRAAIRKQDPKTAKLIEKIEATNSGLLMGPKGDGKPHPFVHRSGEHLFAPPSMLEKMTKEQRVQFKQTSAEARTRPEVAAAFEQMKALWKEDESMRKKRHEVYRNYRGAYFDAIAEIDPSLKELIPPMKLSPSGKGLPGGKGKGPKKRKGEKRPEVP